MSAPPRTRETARGAATCASGAGGRPPGPVRLWARAPFDLELTALVLERHPANRIDRWDGQAHRRLWPEGPATVRALPAGAGVEVEGPADPAAVRALFGLDADLEAFRAEARRDPLLAPLEPRLAGLKPQRFPTLWEALCNAVAHQQVSLASGLATLARVAERCGGAREDLVRLPTPEALLEADLAGTGLSAPKVRYLRGLAGAVARGELRGLERASTAEAYEALRRQVGIGPWSAEYVLLRGLGRLDAFPADDAGAARGLAALCGLPRLAAAEVRALVARWGEWRGLVYFWLLGWKRTGGGGGDERRVQ